MKWSIFNRIRIDEFSTDSSDVPLHVKMSCPSENLQEPRWVMDMTSNGVFYWRRHPNQNRQSRVTFRYDVQVREVERYLRVDNTLHNIVVFSSSLAVCFLLAFLIQWYLLIGSWIWKLQSSVFDCLGNGREMEEY